MHRLLHRLAAVLAASVLQGTLASCGTLQESDGDGYLPNAVAGPFREIARGELGNSRAAPHVMDDGVRFSRDPSVVDLDGDPSTLAVAGFFAATQSPEGAPAAPLAPPNVIFRYDAPDGRSFERSPVIVLQPEAPWEGGTVGAPSALLVKGGLWLYYAAAGGIGLARSSDGIAFRREPAPVLAPERDGWERGATPGSPGVVALPDGSFRMFYEVSGEGGASSIGEARSADGVRWERAGEGPALAPSPASTGEGSDEEPYDDASVGDPAPALAISATGRRILRVYYAGGSRAGRLVIGLAARVGDEMPLQRAASPVFGAASTQGPRAPCVNVYPDFALLFATERAGTGQSQSYPAVIAGVAPADGALPPPGLP